MSALLSVLLFFSVFVLATLAQEGEQGVVAQSPPVRAKNWNKLDMHAVEKEWEAGDDASILEEEFEVNRRILARKQPKFNAEDGESIRKAYDSDPFLFSGGGGSMMLFVDLKDKQPNGKPWTSADVDELTKRYAGLLRSGSVVTTIYNIGDNRLLVSAEKTWQTKDVLIFLSRQKEVKQFNVNSKNYEPKQWRMENDPSYDPEEEDDDDDEL